MYSLFFSAITFVLFLTVNSRAISPSRPSCSSFPPQPTNGFMKCSFGAEVGSLCEFHCDEEYALYGSKNTLCVQETAQNTAEWDFSSPVCNKKIKTCEDDKKADVIFAIDSSVSFGRESVELAKEISKSFISSFSLETNITRFSVFRYNDDIDTDSQILLHDSNDREQLLHEIQQIPNNPKGAANIGNALHHIHDVILKEENGDRQEVQKIVILFTGSLSNDDVIKPAQQLREKSDIYIVGMNYLQPSIEYIDQTEEITRSVQNNILTEPGQDVELIDDALSRQIGKYICRS